jgi:hypothetical protein
MVFISWKTNNLSECSTLGKSLVATEEEDEEVLDYMINLSCEIMREIMCFGYE